MHTHALRTNRKHQALIYRGTVNGSYRFGELRAPATEQASHPTQSGPHDGGIKTQRMDTPLVGEGDDSHGSTGQRLLNQHAVQRDLVANSAHTSAKHEDRVELHIIGKVGRWPWRAAQHDPGVRGDRSQLRRNRHAQADHGRVRAEQQQMRNRLGQPHVGRAQVAPDRRILDALDRSTRIGR